MKRRLLLFGTLVGLLVMPAFASDCPGFCIECRADALTICGSGCIESYSCSLSTCTCSFSSRTGNGCPKLPASLRLPDTPNPKFELASWQESTTYSPPNVKFNIIPQPEVPVSIDRISVHSDPGRQVSELTYTVSNKTGIPLRSISLLVTFFNDLNQPLGGEVIRGGRSCPKDETSNLTGGTELRTFLSHYVDSGQRISLAIMSFRTDTQSWKAGHEAIIKSMKQPH